MKQHVAQIHVLESDDIEDDLFNGFDDEEVEDGGGDNTNSGGEREILLNHSSIYILHYMYVIELITLLFVYYYL